ncbi:MAG: nucleotidyltransferase substrate binding protein [Verrucomicrobiota bacterium]
MTEPQDIRWKQRLENFSKAVRQLTKFIEKGDLNELEQQGLIQSFEYTYELAWNALKDFFEAQGETEILGSRDAFRLAFKRGLVEDGETWMEMIKSRALTSHTYNEEIAQQIVHNILTAYFAEFVRLRVRLEALSQQAS